MRQLLAWEYDESKHAGTDFSDPREVAAYKQRSEKQDRDTINDFILEFLDLDSSKTLLDMGAGFGSLAIAAAQKCKRVYAVDISQAMLDSSSKAALEKGIDNIEFHAAGFLTYEHTEPLVDCLVCCAALHHLPDFWKMVALKRISSFLKPAGRMHLEDHVVSFDINCYEKILDGLSQPNANCIDAKGDNIWASLVRDEFPTYDWILEGMLERAGFSVLEKRHGKTGFRSFYRCQKRSHSTNV